MVWPIGAGEIWRPGQEGAGGTHFWNQDADSRREFHTQMMLIMILKNHHKYNNITTVFSAHYMLGYFIGVLFCVVFY